MNDQVSIKINIADRIYPLKVFIEEEEKIRKAADLINKKVNLYTEQYGIKDKITALSMCSLEIMSDMLTMEDNKDKDDKSFLNQLSEIEELLDNQ